MKALVCGGRDYSDRAKVFAYLDGLDAERDIYLIIHGGAGGADSLGGQWAHERGVAVKVYPANWTMHGRAAGPIRNQQMLDEGKPDLVVAFPGGRGTADMIRRARAAGIEVFEVTP